MNDRIEEAKAQVCIAVENAAALKLINWKIDCGGETAKVAIAQMVSAARARINRQVGQHIRAVRAQG